MTAAAKILILYGSSSPHGKTTKMVEALLEGMQAEAIDVGAGNITPYDYHHTNQNDDFFAISKKMIAADILVFATPVYWYAMSAQMKVFFDRFSDLITIRKADGRALAGKQAYLLVNGTGDLMPEGFEVPFERTCGYFGIAYNGAHYIHTGKNQALALQSWEDLNHFKDSIFSNISEPFIAHTKEK